MTFGNWMKILEISLRKSSGICRKMKDHQHLRNEFHRAGKIKIPACKTLLVWTKNEENFENFQ